MLYNPAWNKEPSLEGFIEFLESKDADECYHWWSGENCAVGQYAKTIGRWNEWLIRAAKGPNHKTWHQLDFIALDDKTFGGCLIRAREALAYV